MELAHLKHELDSKRLKQKEWQVAIDQLREPRDQAEAKHTKVLEQVKELTTLAKEDAASSALEWYKEQLDSMKRGGNPPSNPEEDAKRS